MDYMVKKNFFSNNIKKNNDNKFLFPLIQLILDGVETGLFAYRRCCWLGARPERVTKQKQCMVANPIRILIETYKHDKEEKILIVDE